MALQQLEATSLLRRVDSLISDASTARGVLASRPLAAEGGSVVTHAARFASLPHAVALRIFGFMPADARALAALVCRAWRDAVAEPSLWTRLDLSPASGVSVATTDAVLRGAAARARGQLTALVLSDRRTAVFSADTVVEVLAANAGSLRELHWVHTEKSDRLRFLPARIVERLARAAPQLRVFRADVGASAAAAAHILRNDAPFEALQLRFLRVSGADDDDADVLALAAAMAAHTSLLKLCLVDVSLDTPAVLDAVTAAVISSGLKIMSLNRCDLSPASVPALARLLRSASLTSLSISNGDEPLFDAAAAVQLADVIAAHHTLQRLSLMALQFWHNQSDAATVMRGVTGHPSLHSFSVSQNSAPDDPAAAAAALGALVAANAPALNELHFRDSALGEAGMLPVLEALRHSTHLRLLTCYNTGMSADCARYALLPAVRANTSLRTLVASKHWGGLQDVVAPPAVLEAETLVAARNNNGAATQ